MREIQWWTEQVMEMPLRSENYLFPPHQVGERRAVAQPRNVRTDDLADAIEPVADGTRLGENGAPFLAVAGLG